MSMDFTVAFGSKDTPDWESVPSINVNNANACTILQNLGFTTEEIEEAASGGLEVTPLDMRARCMLALGMPEHVQGREGYRNGNWIEFGTDAEYVLFRIGEILEVCEYADSIGHNVLVA